MTEFSKTRIEELNAELLTSTKEWRKYKCSKLANRQVYWC